jgi:hypothetical protein
VLERISGQRTRLGRFVISPRLIVRRSSSRDSASHPALIDAAMPAIP